QQNPFVQKRPTGIGRGDRKSLSRTQEKEVAMRSQWSYLKVPNQTLEKLRLIQNHISDPVSKAEILDVLLEMGIRIVTSDSSTT
ncbi:MAG: hypothetical protein ACO4CS_19515, partial [bacterium]